MPVIMSTEETPYKPSQLSFIAPEDVQLLHAMRHLISEASRLYEPRLGRPLDEAPVFDTPAAVDRYFRPLVADLQQEQLHVATVTVRQQLISAPMVYQGTVTGTGVRVAEVFRPAVIDQAPGLLVVHNHPSGDPSPSADDIRLTGKLVKAGRVLDIDMLDHVVIARRGYVSLRERGLGFER